MIMKSFGILTSYLIHTYLTVICILPLRLLINSILLCNMTSSTGHISIFICLSVPRATSPWLWWCWRLALTVDLPFYSFFCFVLVLSSFYLSYCTILRTQGISFPLVMSLFYLFYCTILRTQGISRHMISEQDSEVSLMMSIRADEGGSAHTAYLWWAALGVCQANSTWPGPGAQTQWHLQ